ncbi:MAG: nickel pincer cofactor biosynthesis protein LarC [Eubacteriales bacterium]|nr:nickel pincer cofactor biosynthesis protein LarC [Eubacteriales bacterium]
MKKIYIECNMGVSGDMLCGALLDTLNKNEQNEIINKLNTLMSGITVSCTKNEKCGISGTKFNVDIKEHGHHHSSINEIFDTIDGFSLDESVKQNAKEVYKIIANAESKVHGVEVADIHLHEVGMKDAIMDITAFCYIVSRINAEIITCSPIATGYGEVKTAHGILPVPAPATALLLSGIQNYAGDVKGELTTPTGAGLIRYFAKEITTERPEVYDKIGYGMGSKDFEKPNCVRVFASDENEEAVVELKCQIDDMTGEEMGYALNKLLSLGALDVYITPIVMKKSRPAFEMTVITYPNKMDFFIRQIFKHTTTLGIRRIECMRSVLTREVTEKNTVKIKRSEGYGVKKEKPEFDELAKIADERDISIFEAKNIVK